MAERIPATTTRRTLPWLAVGGIALLTGCANLGNGDVGSRAMLLDLAAERGLVRRNVVAGPFRLATWQRPAAARGGVLTVYIEGDGAAWPSPWHPPLDPTPRRPVGLALALADPTAEVAYLARPCQYLDAAALAACPLPYWVERRYAEEIVAAYAVLLDGWKDERALAGFRLVGYSGGGVIATLLAARRDDVIALTTVAAPLSLHAWLTHHGASALDGSLDPASMTLEATPAAWATAVHFAGGRDAIVPRQAIERFVAARGGSLRVLPAHDHQCCWAHDWPQLLNERPVPTGTP